MESDEWSEIESQVNDPNYSELEKMGMAEPIDEVTGLKSTIDELKTKLRNTLADLRTWSVDLEAIQKQASDFEDKAEEYFIQHLEY